MCLLKNKILVIGVVSLVSLLFAQNSQAACTNSLKGVLCGGNQLACLASDGTVKCVSSSGCDAATQNCIGAVTPPPTTGPVPAYLNYDKNTGYLKVGGSLESGGGLVVTGSSNLTGDLTVSGQVKITGGSPGANKVLTSDAAGLATWTSLSAAVASNLFDVLTKSGDASGYVGGVTIGNNETTWMDLGGALTAGWIHANNAAGTSTIDHNLLVNKNTKVVGNSSLASVSATNVAVSTLKVGSVNPGAGKVLTSDANGFATWQTASAGGTYVTSSLLDVLKKNADASSYASGTIIGTNQSAWLNLGGALTAGWLHANNPTGTSTFANDLSANKNLKVVGNSNLSSVSATNVTVSTLKVGSVNPGTGKVLTSDVNGFATWASLPAAPTYVTSSLLDALKKNADASNFGGGVRIGTSTNTWLNLGGALTAGYIHASVVGGWSTFAGNVQISQNLLVNSGYINVASSSGGYYLAGKRFLSSPIAYTATGNPISNSNNLAIGIDTLTKIGTGNYNIGIGDYSLTNNVSGVGNSALGVNALNNNTTGSYNTAIGAWALNSSISGSDNIAIGSQALTTNVSGAQNIAIGFQALSRNTTGGANIAIGQMAGGNIITGGTRDKESSYIDTNSIFIGRYASRDPSIATSTALTGATAIGYDAKVGASMTMALGRPGTKVAVGASTTKGYDFFLEGNSYMGTLTLKNISKGTCAAANVGVMTYEEVASVGHFYGCTRTGASTYAWKQLDN